ncbi:hypothetical protein J2S43_002237 [Catenuloplanes nepalensis]|uniref:Uncharacterized protein n=1 Tax=Catenuloplanes nepalensis TaxID=587533 RepID=A0ABT9MQN8_9ACTN|nr:hypothetical protein [Catenuloplanes nepalensis]MDP9793725.1 hypothetical protein [Catenuloplanes nepalensis]
MKANYARDGFSEGLQWAAVVGMHDSPGLEVGDHLFNNPPNLVDLSIVFLLPLLKIPSLGLLVWSEHVVADISFVARPVRHGRFNIIL